jgi:ABC-type maltose transport system permease subunit
LSVARRRRARYRFLLKTLSLFALLFTRMLPTVVLVPAFFLMLRALGLSNSLTGLVLAYCSFTLPFTVWIMKAYFETVPAELDKSALVDGCNRLQAYYHVVLPVSGPGLVAAGAFTFMLCWERVHRRAGAEHQAGLDAAAAGDCRHERPGQHRLPTSQWMTRVARSATSSTV